jgi:hypothetical protein
LSIKFVSENYKRGKEGGRKEMKDLKFLGLRGHAMCTSYMKFDEI